MEESGFSLLVKSPTRVFFSSLIFLIFSFPGFTASLKRKRGLLEKTANSSVGVKKIGVVLLCRKKRNKSSGGNIAKVFFSLFLLTILFFRMLKKLSYLPFFHTFPCKFVYNKGCFALSSLHLLNRYDFQKKKLNLLLP